MFTEVSVCPSFQGPLPMIHCTSLYSPPPDMGTPDPHLETSGGHHRRLVQICSLMGSPTSTDIWWPPKHIRLTGGRYSSYWNAFLLVIAICWCFVIADLSNGVSVARITIVRRPKLSDPPAMFLCSVLFGHYHSQIKKI